MIPEATQLGDITGRAFARSDSLFEGALRRCFYSVIGSAAVVGALILNDEPLLKSNLLLIGLSFLAITVVFDAPSMIRERNPGLALVRVLQRWAGVVAIVGVLIHLSGISGEFNHRVLLQAGMTAPLFMWLAQVGCRTGVNRLRSKSAVMRVLIVGVTDVGRILEQRLRSIDPRTEILGYIADESVEGPVERDGVTVLGSLKELPFLIQCHGVHAVYITLPMSARDKKIRSMMEKLDHCNASVYFVPDLLVANSGNHQFDTVGGLPVLAVRQSPLFGLGGAVKRSMDLFVSGSLLIVLSPLLALVALGVRISSPGPVIFKQCRYGLYGSEITIFKFRSMNVTEDGNSQYTQVSRSDTRVSRFGAFIRKTSMDELPQLFNVFKGSLSLVGPRPHVIAVNETYRHLIPNYMIRHNMKPGMTGWAQVNGYRGGDDLESMRGRIRCDLEYLRNWSIALDFRILWRTVVLVWKDAKAF